MFSDMCGPTCFVLDVFEEAERIIGDRLGVQGKPCELCTLGFNQSEFNSIVTVCGRLGGRADHRAADERAGKTK